MKFLKTLIFLLIGMISFVGFSLTPDLERNSTSIAFDVGDNVIDINVISFDVINAENIVVDVGKCINDTYTNIFMPICSNAVVNPDIRGLKFIDRIPLKEIATTYYTECQETFNNNIYRCARDGLIRHQKNTIKIK